VSSPRLRELVNLIMVGVLTAVGFASVYTARQNQISSTSLVYAGFFLALFAVAHIGVRAGLPNADPWLLPLAALLCALGLTEIYRLQPALARDQSVWIVVGLIGFLGLIFVLRDHRRLESYKYSLATVAVGLLLFTMVAGTTVNGARLWIRVGGVQVQKVAPELNERQGGPPSTARFLTLARWRRVAPCPAHVVGDLPRGAHRAAQAAPPCGGVPTRNRTTTSPARPTSLRT